MPKATIKTKKDKRPISERRQRTIKLNRLKKRKLETSRFIKRLHRFLRVNSDLIFFKKLAGGVYGFYDYGTSEITIDHRREIIPTLIHEFLHHIYPDWSETRVKNEECRIINSLSARQFKNLLRILGENIQ